MGAPITSTGKARVAVDFHSYTPSASSEAAGFPASSLALLTRPHRPWRSSVTGQQWVVLDLGVATAVPAVFIDNTSFATVTIEGSDTDTWESPAFTTGPLALITDPRLARRKALVPLSGFSHRYLRLLIAPQQPDGGETFYRIGTVALPASLIEMAEDIEYPLEWRTSLPHLENEFASGGTERVRIAPAPRAQVVVNVIRSNDADSVRQVYELLGDPVRTVLFDAGLSVPWESWLCRVEGGLTESWPAWNPRDFGRIGLNVF